LRTYLTKHLHSRPNPLQTKHASGSHQHRSTLQSYQASQPQPARPEPPENTAILPRIVQREARTHHFAGGAALGGG